MLVKSLHVMVRIVLYSTVRTALYFIAHLVDIPFSFSGAWVPTMKVAMNLVTGINPGPARPPLINLTTTETDKMKNSLKLLNIMQ